MSMGIEIRSLRDEKDSRQNVQFFSENKKFVIVKFVRISIKFTVLPSGKEFSMIICYKFKLWFIRIKIQKLLQVLVFF